MHQFYLTVYNHEYNDNLHSDFRFSIEPNNFQSLQLSVTPTKDGFWNKKMIDTLVAYFAEKVEIRQNFDVISFPRLTISFLKRIQKIISV